MGFYDEVLLLLDTNLGTHFALSVSRDITAGELKGKLGMEHFSCFPNLGKIKVHGLTVKKKSFFYHLSDSMAIKHVFEKASKTCLLHLNASRAQNVLDIRSPLLNSSACDENQNQMKPVALNFEEYRRSSPITKEPAGICLSNTFCRKNEKNRLNIEDHNPLDTSRWAKKNVEQQPKHYNTGDDCKENLNGKERQSCISILENSCKNAETISVTGIISKFFADFDEVESCYYRPKHLSEAELVHGKNLIDSMARVTTSQSVHRNCRETVESDADTQCSIAKQKDKYTTERAKTASKVKKKAVRSRKLTSKKSSFFGYTEIASSQSCKHLIGKRLVRAANCMQTPGSRKLSGTMFLSMRRKLISPDPALLANRIAFDGDDFADGMRMNYFS